MMTGRYPYRLCIQLAAPKALDDPEFLDVLDLLKKLGFYGIELNMPDFSASYGDRLIRILDERGLRLTMIASGVYANANKLSLSSPEEPIRTASVKALSAMLECAGRLGAGVICGFIKGGPGGSWEMAAKRLRASLEELDRMGSLAAAPLYLEATNHYEALLVNTVGEGAALVDGLAHPVRVLPDTYHMNIEEASTGAALARHLPLYENLHISDNNRYFPGIGAIDFREIFLLLKGLGYTGTITIEGRVLKTLKQDIVFSAEYLEAIGKQMKYR